MNNSKKIVIGLGIAGGALLAAWLLTGERKKKTKDFFAKKVQDLKQTVNKGTSTADDSDVNYV